MTTETAITPIGRELYAILTERRSVSYVLEAAATDGLWIADLDDRERRWVSPRFLVSLGYPVEALPANFSWEDIADAPDLARFMRAARTYVAGSGSPLRQTLAMRHALGYEVAVEVTAVPVPSEPGGRADRLVGILIDQTEENRLERLLEETNSAARIGAWSVDLITEEVFWTDIVYEIHEIDDPDFRPTVETGVEFYREGHSRNRIREVLARSISDGGTWDEVLEIVTAKGNVRWVRAVGRAELRDGEAIRLQGSFQDVHEARLRELAVERSEALLSNYFDLAPQGMIIVTADGRLERVSESFAEMLGYGRDEIIGRDFGDFTLPADRPEDDALMQELRAGSIASFRREKRYVRKDGEVVWGDVAVAAIRDADGAVSRFSVQLVDITEVKAAEAYRVHAAFLEDKAREMEQFAYIASHDLRQPILTLHGYLGALREDYGERLDEPGRQYVAIMEAAVARMDGMIKGLLDYSRLSKTRALEDVDLRAVVAEVVDDLEALRRRTGGTIEIGPLPTLRGHHVELGQVFQNIIANALNYHRPGVAPVVRVTCERVEGGYEFCISDNGVGISESDQLRVFALFQRVGRDSDAEGTGIGLASCKTIVERHGGSISVTSAPGEGSVFRFSILTDNFA